jgi:flagellar hook protein FlgE
MAVNPDQANMAQQPNAQQPAVQQPAAAIKFVDFATYLQQQDANNKLRSEEAKAQHQDRMQAHIEALERQQAESQARRIPPCDGTNPAAVREWIQEVELTIPHTNRTNQVAAYSATGRLRRELERYLSSQPDRNAVPWHTLAKHLSTTFLSSHDEDRLRHELSVLRRGPYETFTAYGMRFQDAADLAYPPKTPSTDNPNVLVRNRDQDRTLLEAYMAGLNDDAFIDRLVEQAHPANFQAAMFHVSQYESDRYRSAMARNRAQTINRIEEPMEIGAINKPSATVAPVDPSITNLDRRVTGLADQFTKMMACMERLETRMQSQRSSQPRRNQQQNGRQNSSRNGLRFTQDGRPICSYCSKVGHVAKECRTRLRNQRSNNYQENQ